MPVLETLRQALPELSKASAAPPTICCNTPTYMRRMTCDAIAAASGSSRSAVIRLCQKLGFRGYAEFRYALLNEPAAPVAQAQNTLQLYLDELQRLQPLAGSKPLDSLAEAILHAGHVLALGQLHSGMSAQQMAFRLNRFGLDCHALADTTLMEGYEEHPESGRRGGDLFHQRHEQLRGSDPALPAQRRAGRSGGP